MSENESANKNGGVAGMTMNDAQNWFMLAYAGELLRLLLGPGNDNSSGQE